MLTFGAIGITRLLGPTCKLEYPALIACTLN